MESTHDNPQIDTGTDPEVEKSAQDNLGVDAPAEASAESPMDAVQEPAAEAVPSNRHWFIIHTYSGFEQKVADSLRSRAGALGFSDKIGELLIPTEEVVELRAGKKVTSK